jgi:hypothetical protein
VSLYVLKRSDLVRLAFEEMKHKFSTKRLYDEDHNIFFQGQGQEFKNKLNIIGHHMCQQWNFGHMR